MTSYTPTQSRRNVLRTVAGLASIGVAGCLGSDDPSSNETPTSGNGEPFSEITLDGTTIVVEIASQATIDGINLVQPNGELFTRRDLASGVTRVSFELDPEYDPGEYTVVAVENSETIASQPKQIEPDLRIRTVGVYRNNPEKPWDSIYGESETDVIKNGEAFVTVENVGSGPEVVTELVFSGDVPNPVDDPRGGGLYGTEQVILSPGEKRDLFSESFPFGSKTADGMGCSVEGNTGEFTVTIATRVLEEPSSKTFDVQYSGSDEMSDCKIAITED